jgi:histidinol-phosphatase (PHP family)
MLTDYHLHLRQDDLEATPAADFFTHENAERYRAAADEAGIEELGVAEHIHRFADALEVWDHPFWREQAHDDLTAYCEFVRSTDLRLGIEMDFVPGREDRIANLLAAHDFDYVVGSVHFVRHNAVDHRVWDIWDELGDPDRVWAAYFESVAAAAGSGLFDILAHPDLVKVWGEERPAPTRDLRFFYEGTVEAIADSGVAVEVSTAGYRKPVREIYPAPAFAEMCVDAGAVFALSSDAHEPENVGYGYERAIEEMRGWGISKLAVFEGRQRREEDLG